MRVWKLVAAITVVSAITATCGCHKEASRGGAAKIDVTADEKGFTPSSVEVKMSSQVTLVFTRTTDDTCATQVVFPELKLTKDLPLRQAVAIDVPAGAARTLTFQCGMGMFKGKIVID